MTEGTKYTTGYSEGFSDGLKDTPPITRKVRHVAYMFGAYTTAVAAVAYPKVTVVVATVALSIGLMWWAYPLLKAARTKPVKKVKDEPVRTVNPRIHDQRESGQVVRLNNEERRVLDPDATEKIPVQEKK